MWELTALQHCEDGKCEKAEFVGSSPINLRLLIAKLTKYQFETNLVGKRKPLKLVPCGVEAFNTYTRIELIVSLLVSIELKLN